MIPHPSRSEPTNVEGRNFKSLVILSQIYLYPGQDYAAPPRALMHKAN